MTFNYKKHMNQQNAFGFEKKAFYEKQNSFGDSVSGIYKEQIRNIKEQQKFFEEQKTFFDNYRKGKYKLNFNLHIFDFPFSEIKRKLNTKLKPGDFIRISYSDNLDFAEMGLSPLSQSVFGYYFNNNEKLLSKELIKLTPEKNYLLTGVYLASNEFISYGNEIKICLWFSILDGKKYYIPIQNITLSKADDKSVILNGDSLTSDLFFDDENNTKDIEDFILGKVSLPNKKLL